MSIQVKSPKIIFHGVDGAPLEAGKIYIGSVGKNPETDPVAVYLDPELTIPVAQPIRTNGGRPFWNGAYINIFTAASYSITVRSKNDVLVDTELNADLGRVNGSDLTITFGEGGEFDTLQAAADAVQDVTFINGAKGQLIGTGKLDTGGAAILDGAVPDGFEILGSGWKAESSIVAIESVTGAAGAWTVTAQLAGGEGFEVDDHIRINDVRAGFHTVPGAYTGRPYLGELHMLFFKMGSLSVAGTSATLSKSVAINHIAEGDILLAGADCRAVSAVTNNSFTVSAPFCEDISNRQYYFFTRGATGTLSMANKTVTGVGTAFLTELNPGDMLLIDGHCPVKVVSVISDTEATTKTSLGVVTDRSFGVKTSGVSHEGSFRVTAVNGNSVSWLSRDRYATPLPVNNVIEGSVKSYACVIETSGKGIIDHGSKIKIDKIALRSTSETDTLLDYRSSTGASGRFVIGENASIDAVTYAGQFEDGAKLIGPKSSIGGSLRIARGLASLAGANLHAGHIYAILSDGSPIRLAGTKITGTVLDGYRGEVGSSVWGDFCIMERIGQRAGRGVGGANYHFVGAMFTDCLQGFYGENGAFGRATGILVLGANSVGVTIAGGQGEFTQMQVCGSVGKSIAVQSGNVDMLNAGAGGNIAEAALFVDDGSNVFTDNFCGVDTQHVLECSDNARVTAIGLSEGRTASVTVFVGTSSEVNAQGASAGVTSNIELNQRTITRSAVWTGGQETHNDLYIKNEQPGIFLDDTNSNLPPMKIYSASGSLFTDIPNGGRDIIDRGLVGANYVERFRKDMGTFQYKILGKHIIGPRQPKVIDPITTYANPAAPTLAELKTAIDVLQASHIATLEKIRTHGLIEPEVV